MKIICVSSDLMMTGKIASLARSKNIACQIVGTTGDLQIQVNDSGASLDRMLWLIDLQRCENFESIVELAGSLEGRVTLVGYAQHVLPEVLASAESAGFATVMTRGKFDRQIASIIDEFWQPVQ